MLQKSEADPSIPPQQPHAYNHRRRRAREHIPKHDACMHTRAVHHSLHSLGPRTAARTARFASRWGRSHVGSARSRPCPHRVNPPPARGRARASGQARASATGQWTGKGQWTGQCDRPVDRQGPARGQARASAACSRASSWASAACLQGPVLPVCKGQCCLFPGILLGWMTRAHQQFLLLAPHT